MVLKRNNPIRIRYSYQRSYSNIKMPKKKEELQLLMNNKQTTT